MNTYYQSQGCNNNIMSLSFIATGHNRMYDGFNHCIFLTRYRPKRRNLFVNVQIKTIRKLKVQGECEDLLTKFNFVAILILTILSVLHSFVL